MSAASLPLLLRALRLPTIAREHAEATRRAEAENWGYARFLSYLFEAEANERLQRKIQRQLKESNLPAGKTIESLDEKKLPDKIRRQLPTLLEADFVRRGDNLLCFGLAGRGKTHLVAAIAREWICRHQLQVLFVPAFRLVTQLLAAKRDLKLPQAIARLQRFDAVVIDDIGYVQQSREEMEVRRKRSTLTGGRGGRDRLNSADGIRQRRRRAEQSRWRQRRQHARSSKPGAATRRCVSSGDRAGGR